MKTMNVILVAAAAFFLAGCVDGRGQVETPETGQVEGGLDLNGDGVDDKIDYCPGAQLSGASTDMLVNGDGAPFPCNTYMACLHDLHPEKLIDGADAPVVQYLTLLGQEMALGYAAGLATPRCMVHPDSGGVQVCVLPKDNDGTDGPDQCDVDDDNDGW